MSGDGQERFHPCVIVPTYNNPVTVRAVVERVREHCEQVLVVDDGSDEPGRLACEALADEGLARVTRRERNGGKGAAVKTGFQLARDQGFSHAAQVDADGQHDLERLPDFLQAARERPNALILGYPVYDDSVHKGRLVARRITGFWVALELGSTEIIEDAMVGFRVYPLAAATSVPVRGDRMDFDVEIAVRMARAGVPIVNLPVGVRYLSGDEGGVSHFRIFGDNLRLSWMHTRLCVQGLWRWFRSRLRLTP
ncbi:MAG: glycosyltransferase family 2 protein [Polyangiales bacterium]